MTSQQKEIQRLKAQISSDLKLLDEVMVMAKEHHAWADVEAGGWLCYREAIARLRQAWLSGEMEVITLSLSNYFERKSTIQADPNPAAVELGRLGGKAKSERKTEAARINGLKGGRPKGSKNKPQPDENAGHSAGHSDSE